MGKFTPERLSLTGFGGAAGGCINSLDGDPGDSSNLLTRLSTEDFLDSKYSAELLDLMLEFRCGVGGGFLLPGLDVLLDFLAGEPALSSVGDCGGPGDVEGGGGGGGGGSNSKLLSGGGGGNSGDGTENGCHFGFALTAGGDCGAVLGVAGLDDWESE